MRIRYFEDTDTLLIELRQASVVETRDLDEHTVIDVDEHGSICAITIEHASTHAGARNVSFERISA